MKYWDKVNPDLPDLDSDILVKPATFAPEEFLEFALSKINSRASSSGGPRVEPAIGVGADTTCILE
ncbi:hypothetical protein E4U26_006611 [Claviceps purpurea]|nr:hypothetical protein E4U26_006611 [Claviceps purpurea]